MTEAAPERPFPWLSDALQGPAATARSLGLFLSQYNSGLNKKAHNGIRVHRTASDDGYACYFTTPYAAHFDNRTDLERWLADRTHPFVVEYDHPDTGNPVKRAFRTVGEAEAAARKAVAAGAREASISQRGETWGDIATVKTDALDRVWTDVRAGPGQPALL